MFDLVVLGIPNVDTFRQYTLSQLMERKFKLTFRQSGGSERSEECYCSPSNDPCEEGEYSVFVQLEHPMIRLDIFVTVNNASGEGRITTSRPRGGMVNPWPFLTPADTARPSSRVLRYPSDEPRIAALSRQIDECNFSGRTCLRLTGHSTSPSGRRNEGCGIGLTYIWQLCELTEVRILSHRRLGLGPKSMDEIRSFLSKHDLSLGMDLTRFRDRLPKPPA